MIYCLFLLLFFVYNSNAHYWNNKNIKGKAVVSVPVTDAATRPLKTLSATKTVHQLYKELPLASYNLNDCYRTHQFLFNEIVTIKRQTRDEVECSLDNFFYIDDNGRSCNSFWTLKKNIMPLSVWKHKKGLDCIPAPYCAEKRDICSHKGCVTLSWPWYDPITQQSYSAGTRFVRQKAQDTQTRYAVTIPDFKKYGTKVGYVPKEYAILAFAKTPQDSLAFFVKLLKKWAHNPTGVMGYVWGGCSFIKSYQDTTFALVPDTSTDKKIKVWQRSEDSERPFTGCECSALVLRVAQLCGMPYFYRNTATLSKYLRPLEKHEKLEEGDLIWYSGHVQIVSDLTYNKLIESVGYQSGYGKLHEISLHKVFQGIKTYRDLIDAYHNKKQLKRIDSKNKPIRTITDMTLFKMRSIWPV
jgi:hypothetical protein